jgi:hypothetical protein
METEELIRSLAADVRPVRRHAAYGRVMLGLLGGGVISLGLVAWTLGVRPDLDVAARGFTLWMKWVYAASLGVVAVAAVLRLGRPEAGRLRGLWALGVPVLLLGGISIGELARAAPTDWPGLLLGQSWRSCPWLVAMLSVPILAGLAWAFRRLAPTRLRAAGAMAGLAAGAWSAWLYCLHCPEVSAVFVLVWYTLGIALAGVLGAVLGPRLLRW